MYLSSLARAAAAGLVAVVLAGCTPALDWRQARPEDSGVELMFPCQPRSHARTVTLAGQSTRMLMHACTAGRTTFALTFAELDDPARIGPALREMRAAAQANIDGGETVAAPLQVPGMTPSADTVLLALRGRRPDGGALAQQAALFTKGTRVYQASMVGESLSAEASDTFFGSIRLP